MTAPYKTNLILSIIFLIGFVLVLITGVNKELFLAINSYAARTPSFIWANLTFLGDALAAVAIMILFIRIRPDLVWSGIIAAIFGTVIVNLLKAFLDVGRPPGVISPDLIHIIGPAYYSRSMPSGHTATIFTLTGLLMFYFRSLPVKLGLLLLACLVALSRIAVGVHWPADLFSGAALGCLFAMGGFYAASKLNWKRIRTGQIVVGFILLTSNFYLLFFYDCHYEQAVYLQYLLGFITLAAGLREYYLLLIKR